jgi:hypothetical protein
LQGRRGEGTLNHTKLNKSTPLHISLHPKRVTSSADVSLHKPPRCTPSSLSSPNAPSMPRIPTDVPAPSTVRLGSPPPPHSPLYRRHSLASPPQPIRMSVTPSGPRRLTSPPPPHPFLRIKLPRSLPPFRTPPQATGCRVPQTGLNPVCTVQKTDRKTGQTGRYIGRLGLPWFLRSG